MLIRLGVDTSGLDRGMRDAEGMLDRFGRGATSAGVSLSAGITVPLVAVGTAAVRAGLEFEGSVNKINGVLRPTEAQMEKVRSKAMEMGAATVFSAKDSADAMLELGKAGFTVEEAMDSVDEVLQLAAASGMSMADSAAMAARTINAFGLETKDLAHVNDVLAKAVNSTSLEITDLQTAFAYVGPIAQGLGMSLEETSAALGLMRDAGIAAETSGRALREGLTRLINPTKDVKEVTAELGLNFKTATGELKPLDQIISELEPHAKNTGAMMKLFGDAAGPGMAALATKGRDALVELTDGLKKSDRAASDMADAMMKGMPGALEKMKGSVETAYLAIAKSLEPALISAAEKVGGLADFITTKLVPAFQSMPTPVQDTAIGLLAVFAAAGPALIGLGSMASLAKIGVRGWRLLADGAFAFGNSLPILTTRLWLMEAAGSALLTTLSGLAGLAGLAAFGIGGAIAAVREGHGYLLDDTGMTALSGAMKKPSFGPAIPAEIAAGLGMVEASTFGDGSLGTVKGDGIGGVKGWVKAGAGELTSEMKAGLAAYEELKAKVAQGQRDTIAKAGMRDYEAAIAGYALNQEINSAIAGGLVAIGGRQVELRALESTFSGLDINDLMKRFPVQGGITAPTQAGFFGRVTGGIGGSLSKMWEGMSGGGGMAGLFSNIGGDILTGGINSLMNAGMSLAMKGLGKLFGGLFGGEGKKANDARDQIIAQAGGFDELARKAAEAGTSIDALLNAKNVKGVESAWAALNAKINEHEAAAEAAAAADRKRHENAEAFMSGYPKLLDAVAKGGRLASAEVVGMIRQVEEVGGVTAETNAFVQGQIKGAIGGLTTFLTNATVTTQGAADAISGAIAASFMELQTRGVSVTDALIAVTPAVDALAKQFETTGFTGGAAFAQIQAFVALAKDEIAGPALQAVGGLDQALIGLHNSGLLNQGMFAGLASQVGSTFSSLVAQGYDGDHAMRLMQPTLQTLWELQQDFGYQVDETTGSLINQAREAGIVGEAHRSADEQIIGLLKDMKGLLEDFVSIMRDELPGAAQAAGAAVAGIADGIPDNPFSNWRIPDGIDPNAPYFTDNQGNPITGDPNSGAYGPHGPIDWTNPNLQNWLERNPGDYGRAVQMWNEGGWASFATGSGGFQDFGAGTPAMLHGMEAVVPLNSPEGQVLKTFSMTFGGGNQMLPIGTLTSPNQGDLSTSFTPTQSFSMTFGGGYVDPGPVAMSPHTPESLKWWIDHEAEKEAAFAESLRTYGWWNQFTNAAKIEDELRLARMSFARSMNDTMSMQQALVSSVRMSHASRESQTALEVQQLRREMRRFPQAVATALDDVLVTRGFV
jgi:TP901 family phage tail tape measure protein